MVGASNWFVVSVIGVCFCLIRSYGRVLYFLVLLELGFLVVFLSFSAALPVVSSLPYLGFISVLACEAAVGLCILISSSRWDSWLELGGGLS